VNLGPPLGVLCPVFPPPVRRFYHSPVIFWGYQAYCFLFASCSTPFPLSLVLIGFLVLIFFSVISVCDGMHFCAACHWPFCPFLQRIPFEPAEPPLLPRFFVDGSMFLSLFFRLYLLFIFFRVCPPLGFSHFKR